VNEVTSCPSEIPVVTGAANESTVHSTNVLLAFCFWADERTGVSSGARIVNTSNKSSLLDTLAPCTVVADGVGSNVLENAMIFKKYN
jgi:hypothetical protein